MTISNSYIFFSKPYANKKDKQPQNKKSQVFHLDTVRLRIQRIFSIDKNNVIKQSAFQTTYSFAQDNCNVQITISEVVKDGTYVQILVTGKTKQIAVECLEKIELTLETSKLLNDYVKIVSYDAVSEYYCNKLYPKLNQLERNLRKLLFNTYTLQFDLDYYSTTVPASLQEKAKQIIKAKGNKQKKELDYLKEFFYSFDYNDYQVLLFTPQWTSIDHKEKEDFLNNNTNLNELTDEELREALNKFTPKSEWCRLFNGKTSSSEEDISELLDSVRQQRNNVAHCRFLNKNNYEKCNKDILKLNREIVSAIELTETKDFYEKNSKSFMLISNQLKGVLLGMGKLASEMARITMPAVSIMAETIKQFSQNTVALTGLFFDKENEDDI